MFHFVLCLWTVYGMIYGILSTNLSCSNCYSNPYDVTNCSECKHECTDTVHNIDMIMDCLGSCGFSIVKNIYNVATLEQIYHRFYVTFDDMDRYRYRHKAETHLRGKRKEYVMPHFEDIEGFESVIYNELIANSASNFMEESNANNEYETDTKYVFDTMTIIEAPGNDSGGDVDQEYHGDGAFGVKLQIPLINITHLNGPVEIVPLQGICPTIKGVVSIGSVIMYLQPLAHRGSKNNDLHHRPVIDMSFLTSKEHFEQDYLQFFRPESGIHMRKHQQVFNRLCAKSQRCRFNPPFH
eukprot:216628_1